MLPAMDVRRTIRAFPITDRQVSDFEIEFGGTKQEIEIAERIKVTKVSAVGYNQIIVSLSESLCTAQSILNRLTK